MIERLKPRILKTKHLVHRIVEETADACRSYPGRLGFEIQHLPNEAGLPKQTAVKPGSIVLDRRRKLGNHPHGKRSRARDLLMAAHLGRQLPGIALLEAMQEKLVRTSGRPR